MAAHKMPDGRWCVWLDLGDDPETGRRKRKRVEAKTKRLAEGKAADLRARMDRGEDVTERPRLLSELFDDWLAIVERAGRVPNTMRTYRGAIKNHLAPRLGAMVVPKLQTRQIQRAFDEFARELAPGHVRQLKSILVQVLDLAVEQRERADNPALRIRLPKMGPSSGRSLTTEEVEVILAACDGHRYGLAVRLALLGLRRGELAGLKWEDFNPATGTLAIHRQLQKDKSGTWTEVPPKGRSARVLTLAATLVAALELHRRAQLVERRAMAWPESPYIFVSSKTGGFCPPTTIHEAFRDIARQAGVDATRIHDCRHTAATMLLADGKDIGTVSGVLGHASPQTTATVYAHALPNKVAEASQELEEIYTRKERRREG